MVNYVAVVKRNYGLYFSYEVYIFLKVQWKNWMVDRENYVIASDTKYSDIIVPTMDTIRCSHILEMLLTNKKCVSYVVYIYC